MRKKATLFSLKRGKLRQSWNKYNLYNIFQYGIDNHQAAQKPQAATYFQKKWHAKATTRAYHGEMMIEKHWRQQFNPTLRSVVPMDPQHLALSDGRDESSGRGSGMEYGGGGAKASSLKQIPYTNMVFALLERRLDVAVHRAMFASSARQARQFVIHGFVKVNGKTMVHPTYKLNPGDMFSVDPEKVLYATGAPKGKMERREGRRELRQQKSQRQEEEPEEAVEAEQIGSEVTQEDSADTLKSILDKSRELLAEEKGELSAKKKRLLRELQRSVRRAISKGKKHGPIEEAVDEQMVQLMKQLNVSERDTTKTESDPTTEEGSSQEGPNTQQWMSSQQKKQLEEALQELKDNPVDLSKPYATPWSPRAYMSPFAFIPQYLEVHQKICSAIYLRHPVARPGVAEVPTPIFPETSRLAFNWYLRNR